MIAAILNTLAVIGALYLIAMFLLTIYALGVYRMERLAERRNPTPSPADALDDELRDLTEGWRSA